MGNETAAVENGRLEIEYSEEQAQALASYVHQATATSALALRAAIGGRIVSEPPFGSLEIFNQRNAAEGTLERVAQKLAELDPDTAWTAKQLYECARFYEQTVVLGAPEVWPGLVYSHFRAVQSLSWERQRELLAHAKQERLTARSLREMVGGARKSVGGSAAQPRPPNPVKTAARLLQRVADVVDDQDELAAALAGAQIGPEEVTALVDDMERLEARVAALRQKLVPTPA